LAAWDPSVPGDNLVALVYQDRIGKAEFPDSGGDLFDLFARMRPLRGYGFSSEILR
jgi:hypothetical protein